MDVGFQSSYAVIVVGGGHAGCEAALACARMNLETILLTMNPDTIAKMSCNPAIGGLAKGHLVREIDALGGEMAKMTDATSIQSRILNRTQGPAVWGFRAQCDKDLYNQTMKQCVMSQPCLKIKQASVESLLIRESQVYGVRTHYGEEIYARAVILTTGTFLNGLMHIGETQIEGGRTGELPSKNLSQHLKVLGFQVGRLKTGTNPRVLRESINFEKTEIQWGDENPIPFSHFTTHFPQQTQVACYITYTNDQTQQIILNNLSRSPLFSGTIQGIGPRYCPSIEDKIVKFPQRIRHQIFLEPEGLSNHEFYLNGLSTSLPLEVQYAFLKTIPGLENAEIVRPGYAVEYDFIPPTQISHAYETHRIQNLFLAGQINGTSGYEEAAAQGFLAGVNAAQKIQGCPPFILSRSEAYMGVLTDDLVTRGTEEPYRLFTSKAEYRLLLRPDNADLRLMEKGYQLGLISKEKRDQILDKKDKLKSGLQAFRTYLLPMEAIDSSTLNVSLLDRNRTLDEIIRRPEITYERLRPFLPHDLQWNSDIGLQIEIELKYEGYLKKMYQDIQKQNHHEQTLIPEDFPYASLESLSREAKEKFLKIRPQTFGQASRIPGITPSDLSVLLLSLSRFAQTSTSSKSAS
jgi:tRNA uridine 5-carboxymethylaminomethyl modification enzyme